MTKTTDIRTPGDIGIETAQLEHGDAQNAMTDAQPFPSFEEVLAAGSFARELVAIAAEEGRRETERLGRELTQAEAERITETIIRQARVLRFCSAS